MQPCSREMQGLNSLLNHSQISLQDLHNDHHLNQPPQIQPSHLHHFDPASSHDDFLEQMLNTIPSCSWPDLNPANAKSPWELNPINAHNKPRDISDDAVHLDDSSTLASKLRSHQISGNSPAAKAAVMIQQQLLMSRGMTADHGLPPMPLSLGNGEMDRSQNDVVDGSCFRPPNSGGSMQQAHSFGAPGNVMNQAPASAGVSPSQPKQKVRARRGQATDPHSIAERLRRERIAERMKALQELVPNANKTDKASMLDEIIDYVKFLQLQVKVLSMSRLGGAAAVAPLVADVSSEGGGECMQGGSGAQGGRSANGGNQTASSNDSMTVTEQQVAKLMEKDMGSAMQYLQGKGLCLMPISLATAISTSTCHSRNPMMNGGQQHPCLRFRRLQRPAGGKMGGREGKVHVLVVLFPDGQGHINPILQFSKRLAFKGLAVTLLNVFRSQESHTLNLHPSINVEHRPRLPYQGTEPESLESHMHRLQTSICFHMTKLISHHQSSGSPIACVVYDSVTPWVLDVAKGFGVPGAPFFTESSAVNAIFYHVHRGWLKIPIDDSSVSLPGLPLLQISDLPSMIPNPQQYPIFLRLMIDQFSNKPDWMFINTFNSLEPEVLQWIQTHTPLKTVGPTVPSIITDKRLKDDQHYGIDLFKSTGDEIKTIEWLDSKDSGSVIYVSFGSVSDLGEEQMEELAWGLKSTNKSFLWVVRETGTSKLPSNLLEEMKETGMVVNWCSQLQVLAHKSVGCFITHCGWNSVLEALSLGIPMVAMPQWTDQMTNAKFVEDVWKVGVRVSSKENAIAGREEIELCIRQVMEGERSAEMRENASRWMKLAKEAVDEGGSSDKNIDEFVAQLTNRNPN